MSLLDDWLRSFWTATTMPRRHVRDADGRVGLVHVLAAGAGGAVRVDADVVVVDLDRRVVGEQRRDDHLREARMPAMRGVERAEADEPVLAALRLEDPVRVVALDRERRRLDPVLLARARLQHLRREAAVVGPAQVHAQHDLRPVLRVGAAGVGLDGHDRVAAVVLAGEERVLLQPLQLAAQRHDRRGDVVGEIGIELEQLARVVVLAGEPVVAVDPLRQPRVLGGHGRRVLLVVPESGLCELLLRAPRAATSGDRGQR